jgi:hypothetical protein
MEISGEYLNTAAVPFGFYQSGGIHRVIGDLQDSAARYRHRNETASPLTYNDGGRSQLVLKHKPSLLPRPKSRNFLTEEVSVSLFRLLQRCPSAENMEKRSFPPLSQEGLHPMLNLVVSVSASRYQHNGAVV